VEEPESRFVRIGKFQSAVVGGVKAGGRTGLIRGGQLATAVQAGYTYRLVFEVGRELDDTGQMRDSDPNNNSLVYDFTVAANSPLLSP